VIELPHNFDFFDKTLLSIFFTVGGLFGESFNCEMLMIIEFFYQVDRGEISLSNFFDGFELLMEAFLVEVIFEKFFPL
jgi:hypothetical protein